MTTNLSAGWKDRREGIRTVLKAMSAHSKTASSDLACRTMDVLSDQQRKLTLSELCEFAHELSLLRYPSCWIVRDAHIGNWLFEREAVSGYVDFGAARCDWIGWDLVRFLSSIELSSSMRSEFIGCYVKAIPPDLVQREAICESVQHLTMDQTWNLMSQLQLVLSLHHWLALEKDAGRCLNSDEQRRWAELLEFASKIFR